MGEKSEAALKKKKKIIKVFSSPIFHFAISPFRHFVISLYRPPFEFFIGNNFA